MKISSQTTLVQVAFTHFVPCFFLGVISLFVIQSIFPDNVFRDILDDRLSHIDILLALTNGGFVAATAILFHFYRNHRIRKGAAVFKDISDGKRIGYAAFIGFVGGSFDILFGLHNSGILALTVFVLAILVWHLRTFARKMVDMLKPGNVATWEDVAEFLRIYLNMLAGFTLVNATLEVAHIMTGTDQPFGFGANQGQLFIDSLYYTVVTMTTLGFGDIVPKSWDGKLLLIFQCLISYVMFALMVGIVTRGVVKTRDLAEDK